jgi:hypothetical protein
MYLLIVFVLNMDSLDFLILIPNLSIFCINLDLQIFIKCKTVYILLFFGLTWEFLDPLGERDGFF